MPMKGGYKINGIPIQGEEMTTGTVFFVDSSTGSDGNSGLDPLHPFATLDYATNQCTANKHDIVYIMPNHAETIASATTWAPDVAGVQYIGIGVGSDMPELTFSATASQVAITGASTTFKNIRFLAGISNVVAGVKANASHITFDGCHWDFSTTAYNFLWGLSADTADYLTVKNCRFLSELDTTGALSGIRIDASDFAIVEGNYFSGEFNNAAIESATTEAASTGIFISNNRIYNSDTASTYGGGIALRCACTGMIASNMVGWMSGATYSAVPPIDPGSCMMFENYTAGIVDRYGVASLAGTAMS